MAGHSKWANIKHRKAAQDAKRGKLFTKLIHELVVAARAGANVEDNPRLRAAVDKALGANMTRDTIDRAIKRGAGGDDSANMEEITYEGYGVNGVAVLVECLSDNRNRTVSEVRHAFSKHGGSLGTDGSVAYLFDKKGQILFENIDDEESLIEAALEAGAEDVIGDDEGGMEVLTEWTQFSAIKEALQKAGFNGVSAEVAMIPSNKITLNQEEAEKLIKMVERLEDLDDVQNVYTNADISDSILAAIL
ncbi:MAG: YebC/PmpR family DNA-binding transcriptional regulator [Endozoicomonadaceae bacterium]|nr:YebC/PmpR family DNA-binding transcriptional regulator [Endozoicomonadaceae bacterium]